MNTWDRWLHIAGTWAASAALLAGVPCPALAGDGGRPEKAPPVTRSLEPKQRIDEQALAPALDVPEALAELVETSGGGAGALRRLDELRELEEGAAGRLREGPDGSAGPENPFERRAPRADPGEPSMLDDAVAQAREAAGLGGGDRRGPDCGGTGRVRDCVHLPGDPSYAADNPPVGTPLGDPEFHMNDDGSGTIVRRYADGAGGSFTHVDNVKGNGSWTREVTHRDRHGEYVETYRYRSGSDVHTREIRRGGGTIVEVYDDSASRSWLPLAVIGRHGDRHWIIRIPQPREDQPVEGGRYTGPDPCFMGELRGTGACARFGAWNASDPVREHIGKLVQPTEEVPDSSGDDDGPELGLDAVINVPGDFAPAAPSGGGPRRPRNTNGLNPTTQPSCHQNPSLPGC